MEFLLKKVNSEAINSDSDSIPPTGHTRSLSTTIPRPYTYGILFVLVLTSCSKNPQPQPSVTQGGDSVSKVQELRGTISRSLSKGASQQDTASGGSSYQENRSMAVDTVVGSVYVSGNEPFTRLTLAVNDKGGSIYIEADTAQSRQLRKLQGRVVRIFGSVVKHGAGDFIRVNEFVIVH